MRPRTTDHGPRTFKKGMNIWLSLLLVHGLWSLVPGPLFSQEASQPLKVIFKDVTRQELFQLVNLTLKQSQKVNPFVMTRAQPGYFEYEGRFFGEQQELVDLLTQSVGEKLKIEARPTGLRFEITLSPQNNPTPSR